MNKQTDSSTRNAKQVVVELQHLAEHPTNTHIRQYFRDAANAPRLTALLGDTEDATRRHVSEYHHSQGRGLTESDARQQFETAYYHIYYGLIDLRRGETPPSDAARLHIAQLLNPRPPLARY